MDYVERRYCRDMEVKSELHKFLIGRGGTNVKEIRESTGARIIFPQIGDPNPNTIQLTGSKQEIQLAMGQIVKLINRFEGFTQSEMDIDPEFHDHFVCRNGAVCHVIEEKYGVKVCFPKEEVSSKVLLKGRPHAIESARIYIETIIHRLSNLASVEVIIPQKFHGTVIGHQGRIIHKLQDDFEVRIRFPKKSDDPNFVSPVREDGIKCSDVIVVTGGHENCEAVKRRLLLCVPKTEEEWNAESESPGYAVEAPIAFKSPGELRQPTSTPAVFNSTTHSTQLKKRPIQQCTPKESIPVKRRFYQTVNKQIQGPIPGVVRALSPNSLKLARPEEKPRRKRPRL